MFPVGCVRLSLLLFGLAISDAVGAPDAFVLDPVLSLESPWSLNQDEFQKATSQMPFEWTSNQRESARAAAPGMTLLGLPVAEVVARFESEKLREVTVLFFGRGDSGALTQEKFTTLVKNSSEALNQFTKLKFTPRGKDAKNAVKADGLLWQTETARYLLEYSFTREVKSRNIPFRAEFVRLEITPPSKAAGLLASLAPASGGRFSGVAHVQRDAATGDVVLRDIPMVDQGEKGYCVVASVERVMRYYGNAVDANELAQIANSTAEGGTSFEAMIDALKKLSARLRVRVRTLEQRDIRGILELVKDYNRAAKRADEPEIPDPGRMIDVGAIYRAMKLAVLREAKMKDKAGFGRFQRSVQTEIEQGVPLLWTVMLGIVPERGIPQGAGGHMRLIIGYNTKTQELLYSDSWGSGHELKRLPMADAYTISTGLATVEPL
ncbi:MAG TPA: cysteine peptidase family C39 domain-containing protein [Chthoniobacteraceae bacterium]|jgi:hypothetical protein